MSLGASLVGEGEEEQSPNMPVPVAAHQLPSKSTAPNHRLDRSTGSKSNIFQPPRTPAATNPSRADSRLSYASSSTTSSRKRPRPGSSHGNNQLSTPYSAQNREWSHVSADSSVARSTGASSPPLINTRYTLAGGLDTPTLKTAALDERDLSSMGVRCSRRWDTAYEDHWHLRNDYFEPPLPLARESNGRARAAPLQDGQQPSWGRFMLAVVGGIAGRMWDFCTASTFRGFYAGGGKGYEVSTPMVPGIDAIDSWDDISIQEQSQRIERDSTPVPGQYPVDDSENIPVANDSTSPRPSKRLHTETGNGWVVVSNTTHSANATPQPLSRRSISTDSPSTRPLAQRPSAVRATSRRSLIPVSRRSSYVSNGGSPAVQTPKRHSLATSRPSSSHGSPLSPEAQRYAERVAKEDRENDRSMRKLNSQLKAMIKEGKQALGTKFEIEDEEMVDEGFSEDI
ncbi:MAG: hypothetical protein M1821_007859 [Bathelium mastoideum]|nr:MAG: hypothetical protein M1821_007859 [Bathelium mastoideum]